MSLLSLVLAACAGAATISVPPPLPRPAAPQASLAGAAAASPVIALPAGQAPLTSDLVRNTRLQQLADAGAKDFFASKGLLLWQITPYAARGRERLQLTFSLFDGAAPKPALEAALDRHGESVTAFVSGATGVPVDDVLVNGEPMKSCCGGGCAACLHSKKGPSRYWTRPPREKK